MAKENVELCRKIRDWNLYAHALARRGDVEQDVGNSEAAERYYREGLDIHYRHGGSIAGVSIGLKDVARALRRSNDPLSASLLLCVAIRMREEVGYSVDHPYKRMQHEIRAEIGTDAHDAAFEKSRGITKSEAVHFAMTGEWKQKKN